MSTDTMMEKLKGSAKEIAGDLTGNEDLEKEGQAQQEKARKAEEADELRDKAEHKEQQAAGYKGEQNARANS